jgi:hypothetical protein
MTLTDGALYDDYEQKCDECRRLRERIKELEAEINGLKVKPEYIAMGHVHDTKRCQCPDCMAWKKERGLPTEMTFSKRNDDKEV